MCAFLENAVNESRANISADFLAEKFSDQEIVLTGYRSGARYAAKVAEILCKKLTVSDQVKLITFCCERPTADLSAIYLNSRLNFSGAFANHDFKNSKLIEIPVSLSYEIRSRLSAFGVSLGVAGGGLLVLGISNAYSTVREMSIYGSIAALGLSAFSLLKMPKYLSSKGVVAAFERARSHAWFAEDSDEFRSIGK